MIDADLKRRVDRLLRGERRTEDLDRLYLGLRERAFGRASVREIGDFVAHRSEREKGPVTARVRDIFVSLHSWARGLMGYVPSLPELRKVAAANLRIATDVQLQNRLALRRQVVTSVLEQGIRKLEAGKRPTEREARVVNYLGSAFIWNQAFTADEVVSDLVLVLVQHKLLRSSDTESFGEIATFLALYVITLMHGSAITLGNGERAELFATHNNKQRFLEVKAQLIVTDFAKPLIAPVCIFWTELDADRWCSSALRKNIEAWTGPLEIDAEGLLASLD